MDLSRYMTALMKLFQLSHFLVNLLLTIVDDMHVRWNMVVLAEFHNFHLSLVEQKLDCGQMF